MSTFWSGGGVVERGGGVVACVGGGDEDDGDEVVGGRVVRVGETATAGATLGFIVSWRRSVYWRLPRAWLGHWGSLVP
jgi:hypothetical protein